MQRIIPNIWCNGTADEARDFYLEAFAGLGASLIETVAYPDEGLLDFQESMAGKTLTTEIAIDSFRLLLINGGDEVAPTPAINFFVKFDPSRMEDASTTLDALWESLIDGGQVLMDLGEYDFSRRYGWVADRFGVNWQLILTDPAGDPRPTIVPQLMFCGAAQSKAKEAVDHYLSNVGGERGQRATYPDSDEIVFSDFTLQGVWLAAMDSAVAQPFTFTEGVSLMLQAEGQEELDRFWAALSADPDAERCGWCRDEFGVSWQVVPANMAELMARPGAFGKLMGMKKIVIDEF